MISIDDLSLYFLASSVKWYILFSKWLYSLPIVAIYNKIYLLYIIESYPLFDSRSSFPSYNFPFRNRIIIAQVKFLRLKLTS